MPRALLQYQIEVVYEEWGTFNWYIVVCAVGGALILAFLAAFVYRALSFRLGLRRGRVSVEQCLLAGEPNGAHSGLFLLARCPVPKKRFIPQECPVCLSEVQRRGSWAEFVCGHGLCTRCLWQLVKAQELGARCPLCRTKLFQRPNRVELARPSTGPAEAAAASSTGPAQEDGPPPGSEEQALAMEAAGHAPPVALEACTAVGADRGPAEDGLQQHPISGTQQGTPGCDSTGCGRG